MGEFLHLLVTHLGLYVRCSVRRPGKRISDRLVNLIVSVGNAALQYRPAAGSKDECFLPLHTACDIATVLQHSRKLLMNRHPSILMRPNKLTSEKEVWHPYTEYVVASQR